MSSQAEKSPCQIIQANPAAATATRPTPPSIPLHILCQQCSEFCSTWDVLTQLRHPLGQSSGYIASAARLGVLSQLVENAASCHLCQMLTKAFEHRTKEGQKVKAFDFEERRDQSVYLHCERDGTGRVAVAPLVGEEELDKYRGGGFGAEFILGVTSDMPGRGFENYVGEERMSIYGLDGVGRARDWIDACVGGHESCRRFHSSTVDDRRQRPTRVLEVNEHSIRLCCNMSTRAFDYLVLSHMWGDDNSGQLRLLKENIADFQHDIPESDLETSSTFASAIAATRALNYRYLWIDSLCIIQDSDEDWTYEARRMAIVYGNAVCNLAFLFPPKPPTPPLATPNPALPNPPRDPRIWSPCLLLHPKASVPNPLTGIYIAHDTRNWRFEYLQSGSHHAWLVQRNWPLFHRAWTFQEYLLSARTLLLGAQNLMYHCSLHFYDELAGSLTAKQHDRSKKGSGAQKPKGYLVKYRDKSRYFPDSLPLVRGAETPSATLVLGFVADWYAVVGEYRGRALSHVEDRIVAFAGIARAYGNMGGLTYVAGLWLEWLPLCLLWFVERKMDVIILTENEGAGKEVVDEQAWTDEVLEPGAHEVPSWSWFTVPVYKYFKVGFWFGDDEVYVRAKSEVDPPLVCWDDIFWADGEVSGYGDHQSAHEAVDRSAFFDFADAYLTLTTYVLPVRVGWPADIEAQMARIRESTTCGDDHELLFDLVFEYFPDVPMGRKSPPRNAIYAVLSEIQFVRPAGTRTIQRRLAGLMLVPGENEDTWKRVGVWKLRISIIDVPVTTENMAVVAERWREYDILSSKWSHVSLTLV